MRDHIGLESFSVDAVIGVLEDEQRRTQPVQIDLTMAVDFEAAAGGDLSRSLDYGAVYEQVRTLVQFGYWRLLESVAVGIARLLLAPPGPAERRAQVQEVEIVLRKPTILPAATPRVKLVRDAGWCDLQTRLVPPKTWLDTLVVSDLAGAYRLHVEAGSSWDVPPGVALHVIAGAVLADGQPCSPGTRLARGQARRISCVGDQAATLLAVALPFLR